MEHDEWLESGGDGSFALGCVDRKLRRKYHALLTVREPGRGDAWNVLADVQESVAQGGFHTLLSDPRAGRYTQAELVSFTPFPHAAHHYRIESLSPAVTITRRVRLDARGQVELRYSVRGIVAPLELSLAPLLRGRTLHELTYENPFLDGSLMQVESDAALEVVMHPYPGMPALAFRLELPPSASVRVERGGQWWTDLHYAWEAERGYPADEHAFEPGAFVITLQGDAELALTVGVAPLQREPAPHERAPQGLGEQLARAAEQFFMRTQAGTSTLIAGFPWFGPWARDALLALPGFFLATSDFERTTAVLDGLLAARVAGLVPNIPALGDQPANTSSIDASLLFVRTVQWLGERVGADRVERFMPAVCELLSAIADARDPRMRFDHGVGVWMERGPWALTWMDALIDGQPVTPRAGYAVEVDALAYNAAHFAQAWAERNNGAFARAFRHRLRGAEADFLRRYWDDAHGYLADGHDGTRPDWALRPNQLFALGLPHRPVPPSLGRSALATVTRELLTPAGLRTLAPTHPEYRGQYRGSQDDRDRAYHQGTVWPWLLGIYGDALLLHHGATFCATHFGPVVTYFREHVPHAACLGQVSEVFSGDAPHAPGGAPAQAWSVTELYRILHALELASAHRVAS
ncbi:MAG TPA: amylo-alpha-1,6-glucosidase [Polyangiales bacterium]|nr:amylo-alpha-1,6-glucosidase [Polyangiales bacterium]